MPGKSDYTALAARTQGYALQVKRLYDEAVKELLDIAKQVKSLEQGDMFTFDMYDSMKDKSDRALRKLHGAVYTATKRGIELEWGRADKAADDFVASVFGKTVLRDNKYSTMLLRHESAMDAFLNRTEKGMNLSDRIWQPVLQLRKEMELALTVSIGEGESASTISRRVRQYLNEPDRLFRRVRDENGNLKLSKAAAEYHPGRGVYRSSYKNAMRLARTETNMAYRTEDCNRVEELDFVLGIRIQTSNNHPDDDICDELAGDYPKTFKWTGWHPQCRCYMTTILPSDEELKKYNKALLNGEDYTFSGKVEDYPTAFKEWVASNEDRIRNAEERGTLPYFIRDNKDVVNAMIEDLQKPFVMTDAIIEELQNKGVIIKSYNSIDVHGLAKDYNDSPISGFNLIEFYNEYEQLLSDRGVTISGASLEYHSHKATLFISGRDKVGNQVNLERVFIREKEGVKIDHELFTLSKPLQGKGLSKETFKALFKQYQKMGANRVDVFANIDVGGYTWARYGFYTTESDIEYILLNNRVNASEKAIVRDLIEHNKIIRDGNTFIDMRAISELPFAKRLLLGSAWDGYLFLDDEDQMKTLLSYINQ